jgi:conjugal transfer pilus assembly protein TrbC
MKRYFSVGIIFLLILMFIKQVWAFNEDQNVFIFVSFSMPEDSLRGWLREADKIKIPVVVRGLVNNSFRDTTQVVMKLTNQHGGVQLNPILFKRFGIEKVPALVVADASCVNQNQCEHYDVMYGDVTLEYALEKIVNAEDDFSSYAQSLLQELKEKNTA